MKSIKFFLAIFVISIVNFSCEPEALPPEGDAGPVIHADSEEEEIPMDEKEVVE